MGGATLPRLTTARVSTGLSPRGRGNPWHVVRVEPQFGSIPAWAGQPRTAA